MVSGVACAGSRRCSCRASLRPAMAARARIPAGAGRSVGGRRAASGRPKRANRLALQRNYGFVANFPARARQPTARAPGSSIMPNDTVLAYELACRSLKARPTSGQSAHEQVAYVDGPLFASVLQCFDQIACAHMSGLLVRSHMNAGQDGFRDMGSKQQSDLMEGHRDFRSVPRRGSIDRTTAHYLASSDIGAGRLRFELLPVSG
jgi:hypothetical protein